MPMFQRRSKKTSALISHNNIRAVIAAIKQKPGQTTSDYRIILANDGVYVSRNTINLILECTAEGHAVVRKGWVTRIPTRGTVPEWTKIKGAIVKQPSETYRPAVYTRAQLDMGDGVEAEILSDANSALAIAAEAMMRSPTSTKTSAHKIDILRDIVHSSAAREDMRAKVNHDYENRIHEMERLVKSQERLLGLLEQGLATEQRISALTFQGHQTAAPSPTPVAE